MLPHEVEPFAQAHIEALQKMQDTIEEALGTTFKDQVTIDRSTLMDWDRELTFHYRAFQRFAACATDEFKQKERLQNLVRHCRLNHKD